MSESRLNSLKLISWNQTVHYSTLNLSLIRTPKGRSEVSVLERCPYKRADHYDYVTFMTALTVLSVAKTRLTLVFKLHLSLLIHRRTKTLSFSSIQNCTYQLHTYSCRQIKLITVLRWNKLLYRAMLHVKSCNVKHDSESVFRYFASVVNSD